MITVRFSTGFSVQYNDLNHADIRADGAYLGKENDKGHYSVWVPKDCIIEHVSPCRTYNPTLVSSDKVQAEVAGLTKEVRSLKRKITK